MSEAYPILQAEPNEDPSMGFIDNLGDLAKLEPSTGDGLRVISVGWKLRNQGPARLIKSSEWSTIARAAQTMTRPSEAVRRLLSQDLMAARPGPFRHYYVLEPNRRVQRIPLEDFESKALAWKDLNNVFIFEFNAGDAERARTNLDQWLGELDLVIAPLVLSASSAITQTTVTTGAIQAADVSEDPPATAPADTNPTVAAAIKRRDALLERARKEFWPDSAAAGRLLGSGSDAGGRQKASRERAAQRLFGVWSAPDRTFYHPPVQFTSDGAVAPAFVELLDALALSPALTPAQDVNGWNRLGWLTRRRGALSERSLAEDAAPDGVPENEEALDETARTPEEVFAVAPEAVIALAREDAG